MKIDDILTYHEMCAAEGGKSLQRGMNFHFNPGYSVILMSQNQNAPYNDQISQNGTIIEYEGHDMPSSANINPKNFDQPEKFESGILTQNGRFIEAVRKYKETGSDPELVRVYEKIQNGIWTFKGYFDLLNYEYVHDGKRMVFKFKLELSDRDENMVSDHGEKPHLRMIPSEIKAKVWKRDGGKCVICGETKNLHYDHELPFSKGGTSLSDKNVRILCIGHNLAKSDKIE